MLRSSVGRVEHLLHVDVGGAGNLSHPVGDLLGDEVIALHVGADDLDVDGRRQAEVQDLGDDVGRLEEELHSREVPGQFLAQLADVLRRGMMVLFIQSHQDLGVAAADHAGIAVGQIDTRIRQADVVKDGHQLVFGDLLAQILLHFIGKTGCFFDAQSGARPHVKPHQASINRREEVLAQEEHQSHREYAKGEKAGSEELAVSERGLQELVVAVAEFVEAALKGRAGSGRRWSSGLPRDARVRA